MAHAELLCTDLASGAGTRARGGPRRALRGAGGGGRDPGPGLLGTILARDRANAGREHGDRGPDAAGGGTSSWTMATSPRSPQTSRRPDLGADGVALGSSPAPDRWMQADGHARRGGWATKVTFHRASTRWRIGQRPSNCSSSWACTGSPLGRSPIRLGGRGALRALVQRLEGRAEVVAAGGITGESAARLLEATGAPAIHGSCSHEFGIERQGQAAVLALGKPDAGPEDRRLTLERVSARRFVAAARAAAS